MKKTHFKNALRNIRKNIISWFALAVVTTIGCGVFFGTTFYTNSMLERTADYFDQTAYEDFSILATKGLSQEEIDQLTESEEVLDAEGGWRISDCVLSFHQKAADVEVFSLTERISQPQIQEGTLPSAGDECALTSDTMNKYGIKTGDRVSLSFNKDMPEDFIQDGTFTVTARMNHPDHFGTGLSDYVYLAQSAFNKEAVDHYYTYIRVNADLSPYSNVIGDDYFEQIRSVKTSLRKDLEPIGSSHDKTIREKAEKELADAKKEAEEKLADAQKEIDDADEKISDADEKIAEAKDKIADGEKQLEEKRQKLNQAKEKIRKAEKKLKKEKKKLNPAKKKLDGGQKKLNAQKKKLDKAGQKIRASEKKLKKEKEKLKKLKKSAPGGLLVGGKSDAAQKRLSSSKKQYQKNKKILSASQKKLNTSRKKYNQGKKKIDQAEDKLRDMKDQVKEGEDALLEAEQTLSEKKEEVADKEKELADAKEELEEAKEKYEEKKKEVDQKIADAQQEIDDLKPSAFVFFTRNEKDGFVFFRDTIESIQQLSFVYVMIFMLIGILVVLSTITILIDNNKKMIGTMKAFGFRNHEIISDYLVFGISAVLLGMVLAVGLGAILQRIIMIYMGDRFVVKPLPFAFDAKTYALLFAIEVLITAVTTVLAAGYHAVRFSALALMSGSAGKKKRKRSVGKRHIISLYSCLIFRNMQTDLARVIASLVIIGGSCFLLGAGSTLRDAFNNMMPASKREINHYDLELSLVGDNWQEDYDRLKKILEEKGMDFAQIQEKNLLYTYGTTEEFAELVVGDEHVFGDYIILTDASKKKSCKPSQQKVLVTNRIAERTGMQGGDKIILYDQDNLPKEETVGGICRCYLGRKIYLSPDKYKDIFSEDMVPNTLLVKLGDADPDPFVSELRDQFALLEVDKTDQLPDKLLSIKKVYDVLVYIMIFLSVILSVFVLLNLVNIFVSRRRNELIIMAVNGFSGGKLIGYLLRETLITTLFGLQAGVLTGFLMTEFLVRIVETEDTMYVRSINIKAWIFGVALEAFAALLINLFAFRRVKKLQLTDINK